MQINMYDVVLLKNNIKGTIIEIYEENKAYEIEILNDDNSKKYPSYSTKTIEYKDIARVIKRQV